MRNFAGGLQICVSRRVAAAQPLDRSQPEPAPRSFSSLAAPATRFLDQALLGPTLPFACPSTLLTPYSLRYPRTAEALHSLPLAH